MPHRRQLGTPPPGATDLLVVVDPNNLISPASPSKVASLALPIVAATSLTWDTTNGGVDYRYAISNANLPQATTAALYWAPSASFDPTQDTLISGSIFTTATAAQTAPYTGNIDAATIGTPPPGAQDLLFVVDPNNLISPADPSKVAAITLPDIAVSRAMLDGQGELSFDYTVSAAALPVDTSVVVYWAQGDPNSVSPSDELDAPVFTYNITSTAEMAIGEYGPIVVPSSDLASPPAGATHLIVDANPPGSNDPDGDVIESDDSDNAEAVATINLDPLEVVGDFSFDDATQTYQATGTILIGLAPAQGQSFTPLVSVVGSVSYDQQTIDADGVVTARVGGVSAPLFQGTFSIDVGQAVTDAMSPASPSQFTIAGVTFTLSSLGIVSDASGGHLETPRWTHTPHPAGRSHSRRRRRPQGSH